MECDGQELNPLESFYGPIPPLGFCMTSLRAVWNTQNWIGWHISEQIDHWSTCLTALTNNVSGTNQHLNFPNPNSVHLYLKQNLLIDIELRLVFEIELMENPINSSPFAVLYPYLRARRG